VSAFTFATTGERRRARGSSAGRQSQQAPAATPAVARQAALLRRAVDAAWARCRRARSLRELAACIDAQPRPVSEIMRAQLLYELSQMGVQATWRGVREGRAAAEILAARLAAAQPGGPERSP